MEQLDFTEFMSALDELEKDRGLDRQIVLDALKHGIASAIKARNSSDNRVIEVDIDEETRAITFWVVRVVVEEVQTAATEISLEEAQKENPGIMVGEVVRTQIDMSSLGRIPAQTIKHVVFQKIKEAERANIRAEYEGKKCEIVTVIINDTDRLGNVYVTIGDNVEGVILKDEQVRGEVYTPGSIMKAEVLRVDTSDKKGGNKNGRILLSRRRPMLVKRLLELEVPELQRGVIVIKAIAREAGIKTKIAVASTDEKLAPVGACLGQSSMRVKNVVNELFGEKIDIIEWSADPATFIANALSPAKVIISRLSPDEKKATVTVKTDTLSLAIGKGGINAKLAAKLTGWKIDIKTMSEEFDEFNL